MAEAHLYFHLKCNEARLSFRGFYLLELIGKAFRAASALAVCLFYPSGTLPAPSRGIFVKCCAALLGNLVV
jgi:hypothetical protein